MANNMIMQFLCNMTFTPIAAGAAPTGAAPANTDVETPTQRRQRQRAASAHRRVQDLEDRLNRRSYDRNDEPRRYSNRSYYNDRRNADTWNTLAVEAVAVDEAAATGLNRVEITAAAAHTHPLVEITSSLFN